MAHLARIIVPGLPHHLTQGGNRREAIFFQEGDPEIYKDLLAERPLSFWEQGGVSQTYAYDSFGNLNQTSPGTLQNKVTYAANNRINSGSYCYWKYGDTIPITRDKF